MKIFYLNSRLIKSPPPDWGVLKGSTPPRKFPKDSAVVKFHSCEDSEGLSINCDVYISFSAGTYYNGETHIESIRCRNIWRDSDGIRWAFRSSDSSGYIKNTDLNIIYDYLNIIEKFLYNYKF